MFERDRPRMLRLATCTLFAGIFVAAVIGPVPASVVAEEGENVPLTTRLARIERSQLRYDGRSFDEWQREFVTELNPETRLKALPVLAKFARHGYAAEAAAAIVEALGDAEDTELLKSAILRLGELGAAAVPALREKLQSDSAELRLSIAKALGEIGPAAAAAAPALLEIAALAIDAEAQVPGAGAALGASEDPLSEWALAGAAFDALEQIVTAASPELRDGLQSHSPGMRAVCTQLIARLGRGAPQEDLPIATFLNLLGDGSPVVRSSTAVALWQLAADAPPVIAALKEAVQRDGGIGYDLAASLYAKEECWSNAQRCFVWQPKLSSHAEKFSAAAVELLVAMLGSPAFEGAAETARPGPRRDVLNLLALFGPRAAPAVRDLLRLLKSPQPWMRCAAADVLGAIGPKADLALVVLKELAADETPVEDAFVVGGPPISLEAGRRPSALELVVHPDSTAPPSDPLLDTLGAHARAALLSIRPPVP